MFKGFFARILKGTVIILLGDVWEVVIIRYIRCFYIVLVVMLKESRVIKCPGCNAKSRVFGCDLGVFVFSTGHLLARDTCLFRLQAKRRRRLTDYYAKKKLNLVATSDLALILHVVRKYVVMM